MMRRLKEKRLQQKQAAALLGLRVRQVRRVSTPCSEIGTHHGKRGEVCGDSIRALGQDTTIPPKVDDWVKVQGNHREWSVMPGRYKL